MTTLKERAWTLGLHGLIERWDDVAQASWLEDIISGEEQARSARSFERRRRSAHLPPFKPLADFDWTWPRAISRTDVEALMGLDFIDEARNAVIVGGQGTGKTMIAANIAHQALVEGTTVRFERAGDLLEELADISVRSDLLKRLTMLARPRMLVLDEIGYASFGNRHADLLHASRRYQQRTTMITTSLGFAQWDRVFPSTSGIAGTVDRLVHNATVITIDGDSWRLKREP